MQKVEQSLNSAMTKLNSLKTSVANIPGVAVATITPVDSEINAAKSELDKVKEVIEYMKLYKR